MANEVFDELLNRLQSDDKTALKELFQRHYLSVCKTMHRFIQDQATIEDLAQEVFLRFWEKRHQIEITSSLPAYLRRMAINEALGFLRKNRRWSEEAFTPTMIEDHDPGTEEQYIHSELERNVRQAIDELPPKCRMVFQLSRFEELTYQEIADQMGISVKTVENQMGKALKFLRQRLRSYLGIFF